MLNHVAHFNIYLGIRYDFDLRTGKSETGLRACTYAVEIRTNPTDEHIVWVQTPEGGSNWQLVELQPVSEGTVFCLRERGVSSPKIYRIRRPISNGDFPKSPEICAYRYNG